MDDVVELDPRLILPPAKWPSPCWNENNLQWLELLALEESPILYKTKFLELRESELVGRRALGASLSPITRGAFTWVMRHSSQLGVLVWLKDCVLL